MRDDANIINLTGEPVTVHIPTLEGEMVTKTFPPADIPVPRVDSGVVPAGTVDGIIPFYHVGCWVSPELPAPKGSTLFIVDQRVAEFQRDRGDLLFCHPVDALGRVIGLASFATMETVYTWGSVNPHLTQVVDEVV